MCRSFALTVEDIFYLDEWSEIVGVGETLQTQAWVQEEAGKTLGSKITEGEISEPLTIRFRVCLYCG